MNHKKTVGTIKDGYSLDTLEVTSDYYLTKNHQTQYYQALRKQTQIAKLKQIIDVTTPQRRKVYWKTYHCNRVKLQLGDKMQGSLCRKRWCQHCNRIKTAELIKGYQAPLKAMQEDEQFYHVVLTAPTVQARQLRSEIKKRYKAFIAVKDNMRKHYKIKLNGIRKTEITYNESEDWFNPHFHVIVQGKESAELLQKLWLKQFPRASKKGQAIIFIDPSNANNLIEVFKYAVKDVTSDTTTAKAMDIIYTALDGIRTIQTFGSIRKVKEPKEALTEGSKIDWINPINEIWVFNENIADYTNARGYTMIGTKELNKLNYANKDIQEHININTV